MNITILYVISPMLLSNSPLLTNNHLHIINSNFNKFTSTLFFNPQTLFLKKSKFSQGLGGIVYKISENEQKTISNTVFNYSNYKDDFKNALHDISNKAIAIVNCDFTEINPENYGIDSVIQIKDKTVSVYMTNNIFQSCQSNQGVIYLDSCRCVTMTHTCSYKSKCKSQSSFLFSACVPNDFSINIYNTIVDSQCSGSDSFNILCRSGSQYYRCNNMSVVPYSGYQFEAPQCFSFAMNTVMDCKQKCFYFSGSYGKCDEFFSSKYIKMVNFFTEGDSVIRLSSKCDKQITVIDSVLLANSPGNLISYDNDDIHITLIIQNCIISRPNSQSSHLIINNCTTKSYNIQYLTIYPHFTRGNLCRGPNNQNINAFGCNAGNCFEGDTCNQTIGFPEGVPKYTTFIHTDLQTALFTPSNKFSSSNSFSKSLTFSDSAKFTQSNKFTESDDFPKSNPFTESRKFSNSGPFSESLTFTRSNYFSKSDDFTKSNAFSFSKEFTMSNKFSNSKVFSRSNTFSKSETFTHSSCFTKSNQFTMSTQFSNSNVFSKSFEFTESKPFSNSNLFTKSSEFTESKPFTNSIVFEKSSKFTESKPFTNSNTFTKSQDFSSSFEFNESIPPHFIDSGLNNENDNNEKTKMIAIIGGSVAGVTAVGAAIAAFFLLKKPTVPQVEDIETVNGGKETLFSVNNDLNNIMDEDDPFANDFNAD